MSTDPTLYCRIEASCRLSSVAAALTTMAADLLQADSVTAASIAKRVNVARHELDSYPDRLRNLIVDIVKHEKVTDALTAQAVAALNRALPDIPPAPGDAAAKARVLEQRDRIKEHRAHEG